MTTDEMKLLSLIHNSPDPERAWVIADEIISKYLTQFQSFEEASHECFREHS